nr:MAG TPA: hypothetical protein [Caudoviricetes sp.]
MQDAFYNLCVVLLVVFRRKTKNTSAVQLVPFGFIPY